MGEAAGKLPMAEELGVRVENSQTDEKAVDAHDDALSPILVRCF